MGKVLRTPAERDDVKARNTLLCVLHSFSLFNSADSSDRVRPEGKAGAHCVLVAPRGAALHPQRTTLFGHANHFLF